MLEIKTSMRKPSKQSSSFCFKFKGNVVEVWLGPVDEMESEFVLAIDRYYIPELIATLRMAQDT
jgi:hypothetical protein